MKKILLAVCFILFATSVYAGEGLELPWQKWQKPNLNGDIIYDFTDGWGLGTGYTFTKSCNEVWEIRGELVWLQEPGQSEDNDGPDKAGAGVGCNLAKGAREIGWSWIPEKLNTSLFILGLVNMRDEPRGSVAACLTLIRWEF